LSFKFHSPIDLVINPKGTTNSKVHTHTHKHMETVILLMANVNSYKQGHNNVH